MRGEATQNRREPRRRDQNSLKKQNDQEEKDEFSGEFFMGRSNCRKSV